MTDDLINRARFVVQLFQECDAIQLPHRLTEEVLLGMIDRIEELEAKLAQQDDLVQAAVAAALREAADAIAEYPRVSPDEVEAQHYDEQIEHCQSIILALIPEDTQAALYRVVQAQQGARPIATAPRDGTHILVAPYGDPTDLQVSWFIDGEDRWANWSWSVEPSHWFPLPVIRKGVE